MPRIRLGERDLSCDVGETLLDVLARAGAPVTAGCRAGACQSCLVRVQGNPPPAAAQRGLLAAQARQGFALACQFAVEVDHEVVVDDGRQSVEVEVVAVLRPNAEIVRLRLRPRVPFDFLPGQFVHVVRAEGVSRPYSMAGLPSDELLELHVRRLPGGAVSPWLCDELRPGDRLSLRGPAGGTCYTDDAPTRPLLLAGVGTGLAPLWGIARAALAAGHQGRITLFHGAYDVRGLYAHDELRAMAAASEERLRYDAFALTSPPGPVVGLREGDVTDAVAAWAKETREGRVYLCGSPAFVNAARKRAFLAGVSSREILADSFLPSG